MERELKQAVLDAIVQTCQRKPGAFVIDDAVCEIVTGLSLSNPGEWATIRDQLATEAVKAMLLRLLPSAVPAQAELPGLESLPAVTQINGLAVPFRDVNVEQYRATEKQLAHRLQGYLYPRRKAQAVKDLRRQLKQLKKFDKPFATLSVADAQLPLWRAMELETARRETPAVRRKIKGGMTAGRGRKKRQTAST